MNVQNTSEAIGSYSATENEFILLINAFDCAQADQKP
ncbi:hypothetical protein GFO_3509 [Christiangramia forsetii KT0803]|uniref:Uncharacterized protein n=1 Tax=Christiangramia forsetii (strain DSM 17595 / CGMCC 1.15422 / KT0803) TaxID=411154 RepID=A0M752_CHRFK|nr:hypothetical protein GFO_3509 [Christiangramia forsetii KT0803]